MKVRSMCEILWLVADGELNTVAQADALLTEETRDYARALDWPEPSARHFLLDEIRKLAARATPAQSAKITKLFQLEKEKVIG
jgi:hypothetical protein